MDDDWTTGDIILCIVEYLIIAGIVIYVLT